MNARFQELFWRKHMIPLYLAALIAICGIMYQYEPIVVNADADLEAELYAVILENLRATAAEDLNAVLDTMHSESPTYQQTKKVAEQLFAIYDLKHETHVFRYVGQDGDYAIARFEFSTEQVAGPEFKDNRLDTFHVFRKENGQWKIWTQSILTIEYI